MQVTLDIPEDEMYAIVLENVSSNEKKTWINLSENVSDDNDFGNIYVWDLISSFLSSNKYCNSQNIRQPNFRYAQTRGKCNQFKTAFEHFFNTKTVPVRATKC